MNYEPKDYNLKLKIIKNINETLNDILRIDFSSYADRNIEGCYDICNQIEKEVSISSTNAYKESIYLKQELLSEVENDFLEKFNLYCFLVEKKIEIEDLFPFSDWCYTLNNVIEPIYIEHKKIIEGIKCILDVDKSLGIENLSSYFEFCRNRNDQNKNFWTEIKSFVNYNFPQIDISDILSSQNKNDFKKALLGEKIQPGINSILIFKFASYLPNNDLTIKNQTNKNNLTISFSTTNFNEIFEEFKKTSVWSKISSSQTNKKLFITELLCGKRDENPFYKPKHVGSGFGQTGKYIPQDINFENCKYFLNTIIKGDIEIAEHFVDKFSSLYFYKQVAKFSNELSQLINMSMYYKLNGEIQIKSEVAKKSKI